jgi:hypothetical protein
MGRVDSADYCHGGKLPRNSFFIWLWVVFCLLLWPAGCKREPGNDPDVLPGTGMIYYVSPSGDDGNPGSRDNPWRSPGVASRKLTPGDTLIILGGRYQLKEYDADILMPAAGEENNWITIKGETSDRPVLAGSNNLQQAIALASYLRVENLEITSDNGAWFRTGLGQSGEALSHIVLKDLYIHHIDEGGIDIADVSDLTIQNCVITYTGFGSIGGPRGESGGWSHVLVDHCQLSYNGHYYRNGPGPSPYDRPDGFGIEPGAGPIEIRYTRAEHNRGDGLDSKARNTYIHHCIVANNSCDGIKLWAGDSKIENCLVYGTGDGMGGASPWAGVVIDGAAAHDAFEIINCTIHDNRGREAFPMYVGYDENADITLTMKNCIIANGYGAVYFGPRVTLACQYNLFFRPGEDIQVVASNHDYSSSDILNGLLGPGNRVADPLFIGPSWGSPGDYHLANGSPAIDSGTADGAPATDLEDHPRPAGSAYDLGAYEKQ